MRVRAPGEVSAGVIVAAFADFESRRLDIMNELSSESIAGTGLIGLAPIGDDRARVLVLGSFPGEASLIAARYYGHPRNQFWRLIGSVVGLPLQDMDYETRLARLAERRVAVWDVIARCERVGSLDTAIRAEVANDIGGLLRRWKDIGTIAFNGGKAASYRRRIALLPEAAGLSIVVLPSSSPANATHSLAIKEAAWRAALIPALARR